MNSKQDVKQIASDIIDTLNANAFFEENIFVGKSELLEALIETMRLKHKKTGEILLSESEFMRVIHNVTNTAINEALENLLDKDAIKMSIGEDGEICYSANPNFDINNLNNHEED